MAAPRNRRHILLAGVYESRKGAGVADARGWEVARFDYRLSERGLEGVRWLDTRYPEEASSVRTAVRSIMAAGTLNYVGLSLAAKTFWILSGEGRAMTFEGISEKAQQFRWNVSEDDVRNATHFLQALQLATVSAPPAT